MPRQWLSGDRFRWSRSDWSPLPKRTGKRNKDRGQSTVEFVLLIPVLVISALVIVQVGLVVRDSLVVQDLAREVARAAAVEPKQAVADRVISRADARLESSRTQVTLQGGATSGELVTATVKYSSPTSVPLVGLFIGDVPLAASVTMQTE